MSLKPQWLCNSDETPFIPSQNKNRETVEKTIQTDKENNTIKEGEHFLGQFGIGPYSNYDPIAEIHYYSEFLKSMPIPANYLTLDSLKEPEENRYGELPEDFYNEDRYLNLNVDIDNTNREEEYISDKCHSSDSESDDEWHHA